jgi:hypothetical protein
MLSTAGCTAAALGFNNLTDQVQSQVKLGQLSPAEGQKQVDGGYAAVQQECGGSMPSLVAVPQQPAQGHGHHPHHHAANQVLTGALGPQVPNH